MTGNKANAEVDEAWAARLGDVSNTMSEDTVDGGRILELLA